MPLRTLSERSDKNGFIAQVMARYSPTHPKGRAKQLSAIARRIATNREGRNAAWAICDQATFAASNFALSVILARSVTPKAYGPFAIAQSLFLLIAILHNAFITEPMLVFGPTKRREDTGRYFGIAIVGHLAFCVALEALLMPILAFLRASGEHTWAEAAMAISLGAPLTLLGWTMRRACYVNGEPNKAAAAGLTYIAILTGLALGLSASHHLDSVTAFLAMGIATIPVIIWLFRSLEVLFPSGSILRSLYPVFQAHWQYGIWAAGAAVVRWMPFNLVVISLTPLAGPGTSASARVLMNLLLPASHFFQATNAMLLPLLVRQVRSVKFKETLMRWATIETAAVLVYCGALAVGSKQILHMIYGGRYDSAAAALGPLSLFLFGESIGSILANALRAKERPDSVFYGYIWGAGATILGILVVIPRWGLSGAAVIVPVAYTAPLLAFAYAFRKSLRTPPYPLGYLRGLFNL